MVFAVLSPGIATITKFEAPMDRRIIPLIMCGGAGTQLWPASREIRPKQFLPLFPAQLRRRRIARRRASDVAEAGSGFRRAVDRKAADRAAVFHAPDQMARCQQVSNALRRNSPM